MGKYMRKRKAAGKGAVVEVSQGSFGVKTRAKTLALEEDRKLASAKNERLKKQKSPSPSVADFQHKPCYLELRSRKLQKVFKEVKKPYRGHLMKTGGPSENDKNSSQAEIGATVSVGDRARPAVVVARIADEGLSHEGVIVDSSQAPELPDSSPVDSSLSSRNATLDSQSRSIEPIPHAGTFSSGILASPRFGEGGLTNISVDGEGPVIEGPLPQLGLNSGHAEVDVSFQNIASEGGVESMRSRSFRRSLSPVSSSPTDPEKVRDDGSGLSPTGGVVARQDRRSAHHYQMMSRRYMRTNLFVDAEAIDELFAQADTKERDEGKRFSERYNFDVVNDLPLKGRYEWVAINDARSPGSSTPQVEEDQAPQAMGTDESFSSQIVADSHCCTVDR